MMIDDSTPPIKELYFRLDADGDSGFFATLIRDLLVRTADTSIPDYEDWGLDHYEEFDLGPDDEDHYNRVHQLILTMRNDKYQRDELSVLAMGLSLCPIHFIDWAICFDDEDETCEQVRFILPYSHDT